MMSFSSDPSPLPSFLFTALDLDGVIGMSEGEKARCVVRKAIFKWAEIRKREREAGRSSSVRTFLSVGEMKRGRKEGSKTLGGKSWMKQSLCNLYPSFPALAGILMKAG